jgi:four helix bundle protein
MYGAKRMSSFWEFITFTTTFPKQETYGLAQQLRRAALSVPANIAEGFRRRGKPDTARYMNIAEDSLEECRYYLILAQDLWYGVATNLANTAEEISRLLTAYTAAILSSDSCLPSSYFPPNSAFSCLYAVSS